MESNISVNHIEMAIIYIFVISIFIIGLFLTMRIHVRKKFGSLYLRPSELCKMEINNEKLVTEYIKILLEENISHDICKKIMKKIGNDNWLTFERVCIISEDLQYEYKDEEINVQIGKLIHIISMEYRGVALYKLTRSSGYVYKEWHKIIMEAELKSGVTTGINVSEIPFKYNGEQNIKKDTISEKKTLEIFSEKKLSQKNYKENKRKNRIFDIFTNIIDIILDFIE